MDWHLTLRCYHLVDFWHLDEEITTCSPVHSVAIQHLLTYMLQP